MSIFPWRLLLFAFVLPGQQSVGALLQSRPPQAEPKAATPAASTVAERMADTVIELTNAERERQRLSPLKRQEQLMAAAMKHAEDMAKNGYFSHTDQKGGQPWDRAAAEGYAYRSCAENIAYGAKTPQQVVQMWLKSPGHRKNLLGDFTDIGVGYAQSPKKDHRAYWVQVFGVPAK